GSFTINLLEREMHEDRTATRRHCDVVPLIDQSTGRTDELVVRLTNTDGRIDTVEQVTRGGNRGASEWVGIQLVVDDSPAIRIGRIGNRQNLIPIGCIDDARIGIGRAMVTTNLYG